MVEYDTLLREQIELTIKEDDDPNIQWVSQEDANTSLVALGAKFKVVCTTGK